MIGFEDAFERLVAVAEPIGREEVVLADAHRRILSDPVIAMVSAPPADVSAMDGYAVREMDLTQLPVRLKLAGQSFAGNDGAPVLKPGECIRIFTGAPVPAGADRVVVQEIVGGEGEFALFERRPGSARHIREAGSDFRKGDLLLEAGAMLGPRQLVAAAAADLDRVRVWRRPRLMVLGTGDELAEPGAARNRPGSIPQSLSFGIAALAEEGGARFIGAAAIPDRLPEMEQAAALALRDADVVVVTGGASVGERDLARAMFDKQGLEPVFSKVAIKPGKPVWLARAAGGRIVLGLPGNPTSAMVTARLFLSPLIAGLTGRDPRSTLRWRELPLGHSVPAAGERETFARGLKVEAAVHIPANQDSSAQRILAQCDLLVRRPAGAGALEAGDLVPVLDF